MPRHLSSQCTICRHEQRLDIELALARGISQKAVAAQFGISKDAVHGHWHNHVDDERRARLLVGPVPRHALAAKVCEESTNVIDQLRVIRAALFDTLDSAMKAGDRFSAAQVSGRLHDNLRLVGNITGVLASSPLVQINNNQTSVTALLDSPALAAFQSALLRILQRHPAALADVLAEFARLEGQAMPPAAAIPRPALEHAPDV